MIGISDLNELLVSRNCLHAMSIQLDSSRMTYDLSLSVSDSENLGSAVVDIRFIDISQLASRDFGGGLTQIMHMNVIRVDSGFDRARYKFSALEDGKLSFYFSSFSVDQMR
ncbi:hypothetical protein [Pseudomonas quercus]|uniref:hypothetical protein n=1 Tax=Pseudomonas quercus TaxID=2722792 RepID=UPI001FE3658C|nr:hypothetical protein [Pseudomonas quercus]